MLPIGRPGSRIFLVGFVLAVFASPLTGPSANAVGAPRPSPAEPASASTVRQAPVEGEPCGQNAAWVSTQSHGLACLDAAGWHVYTKASGPITSDQVHDVVSCADGRVWVATTLGLWVTDGKSWEDRSGPLQYKTVNALACDSSGGVWLAAYGGVGRLDATGTLTWHAASNLGTGPYVSLVNDVAVGADGSVWAMTSNSVAVLRGSKWTVYEKGHGFSKVYYFDILAVDRNGRPWAGMTDGVVTFDGTRWRAHTIRSLFQPKAIAVDLRNRVWVGTYADGVSVWNGSAWSTYSRANSKLSSNQIHSLAVDGRGRTWIGTEWGLNVLAGSTWTSYHVHTSALPDNEIGNMAIIGRGPTLVPLLVKRTGAIAGTVVKGTAPQSGLKVEACVEFLGSLFTGSTPCSGQPLVKRGTTGANGRFTISSLPVGRYSLAIQRADGKWVRLTDQFNLGDRETLVNEGRTTDLGTLNLAK